jgi:hypothetical protein
VRIYLGGQVQKLLHIRYQTIHRVPTIREPTGSFRSNASKVLIAEGQEHSRAKNLVAEIDKYLPANYSVQTASVRDSLFVTAFESMTDAFLAVIGGKRERCIRCFTILCTRSICRP